MLKSECTKQHAAMKCDTLAMDYHVKVWQSFLHEMVWATKYINVRSWAGIPGYHLNFIDVSHADSEGVKLWKAMIGCGDFIISLRDIIRTFYCIKKIPTLKRHRFAVWRILVAIVPFFLTETFPEVGKQYKSVIQHLKTRKFRRAFKKKYPFIYPKKKHDSIRIHRKLFQQRASRKVPMDQIIGKLRKMNDMKPYEIIYHEEETAEQFYAVIELAQGLKLRPAVLRNVGKLIEIRWESFGSVPDVDLDWTDDSTSSSEGFSSTDSGEEGEFAKFGEDDSGLFAIHGHYRKPLDRYEPTKK